MLKKKLALLMAGFCIFSALSVSVLASGSGSGRNGSADHGERELRYSDFEIEDGILYQYTGGGGAVVIPDGIIEIGAGAFKGCTAVTHVTIPESVAVIADEAFSGCTGLKEIDLPDELIYIGQGAFRNCSSWEGQLVIPKSVEAIDGFAFQNCSSITGALVVPMTMTHIPKGLFSGMSGVERLVIHEEVGSVSASEGTDHAFYGMTGLKELTFEGAHMPRPADGAGSIFAYMSALEAVYVPAANYEDYRETAGDVLPDKAELRCIPGTEFVIQGGVLLEYLGIGGKVILPEGITAIGENVFDGCTALTEVVFPKSLTSIGAFAFYGCTGLTEVILPDGLTEIGEYAFGRCSALQKADLPAGLTVLSDWMFADCENLETADLPQGLQKIGEAAFSGCKGLKGQPVIPETVRSIGAYAFHGCSGLTGDLILPDSIGTIGIQAFDGCTAMDGRLDLSAGMTEIGADTFAGLRGITSVYIPQSVRSIHWDAFFGMEKVTEVTFAGELPPTLVSPWEGPLFAMDHLQTVYVPNSAYADYRYAYETYLADGIELSRQGERTTQCVITEAQAVLFCEDAEQYIEEGCFLFMAAYDKEDRLIAVTDQGEVSVDGVFKMSIDQEGIRKVHFFVLDHSYLPLQKVCDFYAG